MKKFGYTIHKDLQIDWDKNDHQLAEYLEKEVPSWKACMACGSCAASCSAANFIPFSFRKVHTLIQRGELSELKQEIAKCMFCGKCTLVCPRGVDTRNLIRKIHDGFQLR